MISPMSLGNLSIVSNYLMTIIGGNKIRLVRQLIKKTRWGSNMPQEKLLPWIPYLINMLTIMSSVRNRPATELVMLKVHNVKLSFDIWLVLYIYFILYSWQYPPFKAYGLYMEVIWIAIPKGYAIYCSLRALTLLWGF